MGNGVNSLKEIGAQKIHHETHISREYVQAIIHENFESINSVQFIGFVSILEREYNLDLSELKANGVAFFTQKEAETPEVKKVFVVPKRKKSNKTLYITLSLLVIGSFIYYTFIYLNSLSPSLDKIDNAKIKTAQKSITTTLEIKKPVVEDLNKTKPIVEMVVEDTNITKIKKVEIVPEVIKTLKLIPKNKIWAGYINIKTNQRYQKIFKKEFVFDTTKDWLLLFGAGTVKLEINGKVKKFSSKQNMRFKYISGKFSKINVKEFKSLNKGRKW